MVRWSYIIREPDLKVIKSVEQLLAVKFPDDYIQCILNNHGGQPEPSRFNFGDKDATSFGELLTFDTAHRNYILKIFNSIKEMLPDGVIPFANDPGGNYICFDYNEKGNNPVIVFLDHELSFTEDDLTEEELADKPLNEYQRLAITYVCNNFTELLSMLYEK